MFKSILPELTQGMWTVVTLGTSDCEPELPEFSKMLNIVKID